MDKTTETQDLNLLDNSFNFVYIVLVLIAGMAQAVAHFIGNEEVTGSTPVASLTIEELTKNSLHFFAGNFLLLVYLF